MTHESSAPRPASAVALPALLGRIGLWCTLFAALILLAVLAANVLLIGVHSPPNAALALLVLIGPTVAVILCTAASYIGYYGTWRIARGKDEYDVVSDLKGHATDIPSNLQNLPLARLRPGGCLSFLPTATLAASLVATGLTLAPPPFRALGVIPTHGRFVPAGLGVVVASSNGLADIKQATVTLPTATGTPQAPAIGAFTVTPTSYGGDCGHGTLAAQKVTLDNRADSVAVAWTVTIRETLPGTTRPWAKASKSGGDVPAGQTDTFQLTPDGSLCHAIPRTGATFHADIHATGGTPATQTVTATLVGASG